ncbi:muts domain V-domain-containing protein [Pavlovales sp. CCMP2436]|nr:muts domain V-domain-containing protein [Pavlovales sp. CCMP2436]
MSGKQTKLSRFFAAKPAAKAPAPLAAEPAPAPPAASAGRGRAAREQGAGSSVVSADMALSIGGFAFGTQPPALTQLSSSTATGKRAASTAAGKRAAAESPHQASPSPAKHARTASPARGRSARELPADTNEEHEPGSDEELGGGVGQAEHDPAAPDRALGKGEVAPGDRLGRADSVPSVAAVAAQLGLQALTPLERQIVALKAQHPGYVLMFEVGYRFCFYGEDAATAAALLDIWAYRKQHLTTASVPTHRLEVHLTRLLQAGFKVGVVDQAETAARKKAGIGVSSRSGTFARKVSALYTRGSYVPSSDERTLSPSNQIVVICEPPNSSDASGVTVNLSLIALDTYSNSLVYDSWTDTSLRSELHARLSALAPVEVLVARRAGEAGSGSTGSIGLSRESALTVLLYAQPAPTAGTGVSLTEAGSEAAARLELLPREAFDLGAALELLAVDTDLEPHAVDDAGAERAAAAAVELPPGVGLALGALAQHLAGMVGEARCAGLLRVAICGAGKWSEQNSCALGSQLLRDLDVFHSPAAEARGSSAGAASCLYAHLNRCQTQPGARLLRRWLCAPLKDPAPIDARLHAVGLIARALEEAGGSGAASAGTRRYSAASTPRASPFHAAKLSAAAAPSPVPESVGLLGLTAALGASPCHDIERALARLANGRESGKEVWHLLTTLESLLARLVAGVKLPESDKEDESDGELLPDDEGGAATDGGAMQGRQLLAEIIGEDAAVRARDVSLLAAVRAELGGLHREGMLSNELKDAFELNSELGTEGGAPELVALREARQEIVAVKRALGTQALPAARLLLKRPTLEFKKVHADEYLIELPTVAARSVPDSWERVCATKTQVRFRSPEVARLWAQMQVLRETFELRAAEAFRALCERVTAQTAPICSLVRRMAELDVLQAFAELSHARSYVRPRILRAETMGGELPPPRLRLVDCRHPTAEANMPAGRSFVPNDVHLRASEAASEAGAREAGEGGSGEPGAQCVLLFGPNMGGKSLYARTALTLALMAQVGCWVPAREAELTPFDGLFTRSGSTDRILAGQSTFMVELSEAAQILGRATPRSLLLFDELGRGTSTHDGTAIAFATLEHLVRKVGALTLFISHYPMLAQLADEDARVVCCHMSYVATEADAAADADPSAPVADGASEARVDGRRADRQITMLYKLARGKLETSFGVNVARMAKLPPEVLDEAARRSEALERHVTKRRLLRAIIQAVQGDDAQAVRKRLLTLQAEAREALARGAV